MGATHVCAALRDCDVIDKRRFFLSALDTGDDNVLWPLRKFAKFFGCLRGKRKKTLCVMIVHRFCNVGSGEQTRFCQVWCDDIRLS